MSNKNSGVRTVFYSSKVVLTLLFLLPLALSQTCLQFSGSECIRCSSGYQLVAGGCVSMSGSTSNPILVFMDIPGLQKTLYSVSNAIITSNSSTNQSQTQQSVVNEFQVLRVSSSSPGNYYQVQANSTRAVQDVKDLLRKSSLLTEVKQISTVTTKSDSSQENGTQSSGLSIDQQIQQSNSTTQEDANLTAIKQTIPQLNSLQPNLNSIKQATNLPITPDLTLIQQKGTQINMITIKQTIAGVEPVLVPVSRSQSATENEAPSSQDANLTKINKGKTVPNAQSESNITSTNQDNSQLLVQLQQISQKLTQVNQAFSLKQAKMNQPPVLRPASFTQAMQKQSPSDNAGGAITLQLTQVGQQLTQINQQLTQAKMIQSSNTSSSDNSTQDNVSNTDTTNSPPIQVKINRKQSNVTMNLSQFVSPVPTTQPAEPNLTPVNPVPPLHWVKATRYELYSLTLIAKALTQVKSKQTKNTTQGSLLTFKCSSNLTIFLPPNITNQSSTLEVQYSKYISNIIAKAGKQLHDYTLADHSTLCFDPPFHAAFRSLNQKHKIVVADLPLFAVYYQFCGFAKNFRVFFLDDTALPAITIHQAGVVVDLYRMAPAEVFFTAYATTTL